MSLETISNPEAISNLYDDPSVLEKAFLHALELSPNDPTVKIYIRIDSAPVRPPVRWGTPKSAILEMQLLDIRSLHVSAWKPNEPTAIKIARDENGLISLVALNDSMGIICGYIYIAKIHPYG